MPPDPPHLSVVVPTYNRADLMERLLDALDAQDIDTAVEVIVVDDASSDDTVDRLRANTRAHPFHLVVLSSDTNHGPAHARNRGWQFARAGRIVFVDDDCVPDRGWLKAIDHGLDQADIVIGRTRPPDDQLHRIGPFSAYLDIGHDRSFSTCNIAYRREALEATRGLDEATFSHLNGEDTDLGLRAVKLGFLDRFVPDALVWHDVAPSEFAAHLRRLKRVEGLPALVARHPEARQNLNAGLFLRSVDKAVLIGWAALAAALVRPHKPTSRLRARRGRPLRLAVRPQPLRAPLHQRVGPLGPARFRGRQLRHLPSVARQPPPAHHPAVTIPESVPVSSPPVMAVPTTPTNATDIAWYHTFDLPDGTATRGMFDHRRVAPKLPIPASLEGKRCLDVAAADGFWSFELAKRGAKEVVSLDLPDTTRQDYASASASLRLRHRHRTTPIPRAPDRVGPMPPSPSSTGPPAWA